ncbi:hypothetical protein KEM54_004195, partial [Ascosphaera aggregata]
HPKVRSIVQKAYDAGKRDGILNPKYWVFLDTDNNSQEYSTSDQSSSDKDTINDITMLDAPSITLSSSPDPLTENTNFEETLMAEEATCYLSVLDIPESKTYNQAKRSDHWDN